MTLDGLAHVYVDDHGCRHTTIDNNTSSSSLVFPHPVCGEVSQLWERIEVARICGGIEFVRGMCRISVCCLSEL